MSFQIFHTSSRPCSALNTSGEIPLVWSNGSARPTASIAINNITDANALGDRLPNGQNPNISALPSHFFPTGLTMMHLIKGCTGYETTSLRRLLGGK